MEKKLTDKEKQELEDKKLQRHEAEGSGFVILTEDDMKIMQEVAIQDEEYRARKEREREQKK